MRAWVANLKLGNDAFAERVLALSAAHAAVPYLRDAAQHVASATDFADMRAASDALATGMTAIGLDNWRRYLVRAEEHGNAWTASAVKAQVQPPPPKAPQSPIPPADGKTGPYIHDPEPTKDPADTAASRGALADKLLKAGPEATAEDVAAVRKHIVENTTLNALRLMEKYGVTIPCHPRVGRDRPPRHCRAASPWVV